MESFGYVRVSQRLARILVFSGGVDVHPRLYKQQPHPSTFTNNARDMADIIAYIDSQKRPGPSCIKVGICRGAQFLCVMNGGQLWQDVAGHNSMYIHPIFYMNSAGVKEDHQVTSKHHQMMKPMPLQQNYELWAWCYRSYYRDETLPLKTKPNFLKDGPDPEILYYPVTNSLCFQPHPEYSHIETRKLFQECLSRVVARCNEIETPKGTC
jgi:GMP synthase-like glutamine amidotransferase